MRKICLLVLLCACTMGGFAQMRFTYDKCGNRVKSQLTVTPVSTSRPAASLSGAAIDEVKAVCLVYPNPAQSHVFISLHETDAAGAKQATMYDLSGKAIKDISFTGNDANIDLSALESAVYFLHVHTGSKTWQWKIVKE